MDSADDGTREVPQWWGTGTLRPALPGKISLACMTPQAGRPDSKAEELLKEYLRLGHFMVPAKVAGWVERVCWKNF